MIRFGRKLAGLAIAVGLLIAAEPQVRADEVIDWNATMRNVMQMRTDSYFANPGYATRSMAMANGAMFDIMMSFDKQYNPYLYNGTNNSATTSQTAAMAQASYVILNNLYGNAYNGAANPGTDASQASAIGVKLLNDLNTKLVSVTDVNARNAGIALGNQVAAQYLQARANDGITTPVQYIPDPTQTPGHWQPDPFNPTQQAWGPNWGNVTPFVINGSTQFNVAAPPALGSLEYKLAYDQVKDYGAYNSSVRTQDQTNIGIFWAYDRGTMGPPPVLYSKNLEDISKTMGNSQVENARLFTLVSLGMADAGVASWEAKYTFDYWRPVTAIHQGANDGNILTDGDTTWRPLGAQGTNPSGFTDDFTPPFPAYPSGHATFGGVTYEILRQFYGTDLLNYVLKSDEMAAGSHMVAMNTLSDADKIALRSVYGDAYVDAAQIVGQIAIDNKMRMFNSFSEAEWENAISRIYLGVHWSFDATEGIKLGNQIADFTFDNYLTAVPEPSTYALISTAIVGAAWYRRKKKLAAA
jgi:hypothetical protein